MKSVCAVFATSIGASIVLCGFPTYGQVALRPCVGNMDDVFLGALDTAISQAVSNRGHDVIKTDIKKGTATSATAPEQLAKLGASLGAKLVLAASAIEAGKDIVLVIQTVKVTGAASSSLSRTTTRAAAPAIAREMIRELVAKKAAPATAVPTPLPVVIDKQKDVRTGPAQPSQQPVPPLQAPPSVSQEATPAQSGTTAVRASGRLPALVVHADVPGVVAAADRRGGWHPTPHVFSVDPGSHQIVVKRRGYSAGKVRLNVWNQDLKVTFKMGKSGRRSGIICMVVGTVLGLIGGVAAGIETEEYYMWIPPLVGGVGVFGVGIFLLTRTDETTHHVEVLSTRP